MTDEDDWMDPAEVRAELARANELTSAEIRERLGWLEAKVVEVFYATISGGSIFLGWIVANRVVDAQASLYWWAVFVVTCLVVGFVTYRKAFKGAPLSVKILL